MDCSPPGSSVEKAMAPHSSTLAWKIPWMEEPGRLQSMGSWRVRHDWTTWLSLFTFMHWKGNGNPLQCSYLENPRDGGAWWAAVYGVAQSWTRLKRQQQQQQAPLSMKFFRQEYQSGLLLPPPPGDLPNPRIEPRSSEWCVHVCQVTSVVSDSLWPHGL